MTKKELKAKLEQLLERRTQDMVEAHGKNDYSIETMYFGVSCGIIDSMRVAEIIDWDQVREMKEQLMKKRQDA